MVNFRDLEVVGADFGTFTISGWFWRSFENPSEPSCQCHSGACRRSFGASWPVGGFFLRIFSPSVFRNWRVSRLSIPLLPVGCSSPLLTTSGTPSEGVAHTGDRFESVMIQALSRSAAYPGRRTTPHYRLFPVCAALVSVILNTGGLDTSTPLSGTRP